MTCLSNKNNNISCRENRNEVHVRYNILAEKEFFKIIFPILQQYDTNYFILSHFYGIIFIK